MSKSAFSFQILKSLNNQFFFVDFDDDSTILMGAKLFRLFSNIFENFSKVEFALFCSLIGLQSADAIFLFRLAPVNLLETL